MLYNGYIDNKVNILKLARRHFVFLVKLNKMVCMARSTSWEVERREIEGERNTASETERYRERYSETERERDREIKHIEGKQEILLIVCYIQFLQTVLIYSSLHTLKLILAHHRKKTCCTFHSSFIFLS